jgi:hypothetical protein
MAKIFEVWFQDLGERGPEYNESHSYLADGFDDAAIKAASERCRKDVEWRDLHTSVRLGHQTKRFMVEVRSEPVFEAREFTRTI